MTAAYIPSPFEPYAGSEPYLFASYAHEDAASVYPELAYLHERGYRIWYDEGRYAGNEGPQEIARALAKSSFCLVFISPRAVQPYDVRNQLSFALARQKPMLAVHMGETALPEAIELQLASIQTICRYRIPEDAYRRKLLRSLPASLLDASARSERPASSPSVAFPVPQASVMQGHSLGLAGAPCVLPPTSILGTVPPAGERVLRGDNDTTGRIIVQTLAEFGIDTQLKSIESGPVVTRYELVPAVGVKVERITNLSNNLALSLKASSVRVQAPIPGKGTVGVEVPNIDISAVYLREIVEGPLWQPTRLELPMVIGKDVGGNDLVVDLATMPHVLIAGATGSGKTVCMNTILAGLLMSRTPDQLQLMLIDPKIVEFAVYNNLPHLLGSRKEVLTDPRRVVGGLRWAITEMEKRYKLMARAGVRNIKSYNERPIQEQPDLLGPGREDPAGRLPERLPYIVIVIDELADLMLTVGAEIESYIARLAQLSRAVGIHMIIATQRPSVNVITGTIKANFPARIAFQVAQKTDSRTILDANGADKLLGRGDMLYLPPGSSKLIRAQGALTTDEDIRKLVHFIQKQHPDQKEGAPATGAGPGAGVGTLSAPSAAPEGHPDHNSGDFFAGGLADDEDGPLIEQAIEIVRQTRRASTTAIQRRLRIGYTRAARIMDILEERGVVGPARGSDPRDVFIDCSSPTTVPGGNPTPSSSEIAAAGSGGSEDEELVAMAIQIIRETHRASASALQRRLRIGYTRATRILTVLEKRGIVGPARGSDPREILIDLDGPTN